MALTPLLKHALETLQARVLASATTSRTLRVPELEQPLRQVGRALFQAVFQPAVGALFLSSRNEAERAGGKLSGEAQQHRMNESHEVEEISRETTSRTSASAHQAGQQTNTEAEHYHRQHQCQQPGHRHDRDEARGHHDGEEDRRSLTETAG